MEHIRQDIRYALRGLSRNPGLAAVGASDLSLSGTDGTDHIEGALVLPDYLPAVGTHLDSVGPHYVRTMRIAPPRALDLNERDMLEGAPAVASVSKAMADRYWPNQNPIGRRFRFAPSGSYFEIFGGVDDAHGSSTRACPSTRWRRCTSARQPR